MPSLLISLQSNIPAEMSLYSWCTSPYSDDIHRFYKSKEEHMPRIKFQSPQAESRADLIDWMRTVAEKYGFSKLTVHLAVFILDQFMDTHSIASQKLGMVGMVCLLIASKCEDEVDRTPRISSMISLLPEEDRDVITALQVVHVEKFILYSLNWRLGWPTTASFAEYYSLFAVVNGDKDSKNTPHRSLKMAVQSSYDTFLDKTLMCVDLVNAAPSNRAAACLLAARIHNSVSPPWPEYLCTITWYSYERLSSIAHFLLSLDTYDFESGYSSSSPEAHSVRESLEQDSGSTP
uniref:Cyclin-J n=2 Tax=Lygus hesperus TaxID=30085 RepID=A0A0A9XZS3_LYGHE